MMDNHDYSPPHMDASRPSLGFPLGTALLLIVIFSLSGIFSCCYHWDKLRSRRRSFSPEDGVVDPDSDIEAASKYNKPHTELNQNKSQSFSVLMPGDQIPTFIALPCPCEPQRSEMVVVKVEKPPRLAVPFY